MTTGERIRNVREDKDILQQELADAIGINVSVLSRIEKGTRPIRDDELIKIANKLSVSSDYLLGISNSPSSTIISSLSVTEKDILHFYRQLDDRDQGAIYGEMKGMLRAEKYHRNSSTTQEPIKTIRESSNDFSIAASGLDENTPAGNENMEIIKERVRELTKKQK
ncbi:helix-turn-helix domain-containing protein [Megasphaera sp.]|uniref:helix-turn-helix domain-containing protein n=1 Tax=Megasphaera sp. TaxID=2023260 RepID=UPI00351F9CBE